MTAMLRRMSAFGLGMVLAACGAGALSTGTPRLESAARSAPPTSSASTSATEGSRGTDVTAVTEPALQPGLYYIDPMAAEGGTMRVFFTIAASGWSPFLGAFKRWQAGEGSGRVGIGIVDVQNLVVDGCLDHRHEDPTIGPSVDNLATALARLAPFRTSDPPTNITLDGYEGKHLTLRLSNVEFVREADGDAVFTRCTNGEIWSWVAPPLSDAFYGYQPDDIEEFWLVDVAGTRLVIESLQSADSPPEVIGEMRAILESIRIEP